jgi:hypothetical protein
MAITKYGKPQQPPTPLPVLNDALPPVVHSMIAALLKHQAAIVSARTVVITVDVSGKVIVKATTDLS